MFNVDEFLDARRIGAMHIRILALLMFVTMLDGYDLYVVGLTLPVLAKAWGFAPHAFTSVFVAQQAGLLIGMLSFAPIADKFGRKTMLLTCLAGFGVCTFLVLFMKNPSELTVLRFISGLFFAGVIPNCVALTSEIAPTRLRASFVTVVFFGYAGGVLAGASVLAFLVEPFGWQSGFYAGAIVPLLLLPVLYFFLPESIRFRVASNPTDARIGKMLQQMDRTLTLRGDETFVLKETAAKERFAPVALFRGELLPLTLMLWCAFGMMYVVNQMTGNFETTVLHNGAGLELKYVALMVGSQTAAAMAGTLSAGPIMDRFGPARSLIGFFFGTGLLYFSLGWVDLGSAPGFILFVLVGYVGSCATSGTNALTTLVYPSRMRVTGYAWAAGVGRVGAMLGPVVGGAVLAQSGSVAFFYSIAGVAEMLGAVAACMMLWTLRNKVRAQ
jgi:AAHS family 4-hydroxybenzoate transporter-like MFS transporter